MDNLVMGRSGCSRLFAGKLVGNWKKRTVFGVFYFGPLLFSGLFELMNFSEVRASHVIMLLWACLEYFAFGVRMVESLFSGNSYACSVPDGFLVV